MAHSRQNKSPDGQDTGSTEGRRHSWQEPKGRKESRVRRVACEPHRSLSAFRSYEVKIVFGGGMVGMIYADEVSVMGFRGVEVVVATWAYDCSTVDLGNSAKTR